MPQGEYATSSNSVQMITLASGFVRFAIDAALIPAAPPPTTQIRLGSPILIPPFRGATDGERSRSARAASKAENGPRAVLQPVRWGCEPGAYGSGASRA